MMTLIRAAAAALPLVLAACGGGNEEPTVLAEKSTEVDAPAEAEPLYDRRLVLFGPAVSVSAETPALLCVSGQWAQWREAGAAVLLRVDQVAQGAAPAGSEAGEAVLTIEHCVRVMLQPGRSIQSIALQVASLDAAGRPVAGLGGYAAKLQWRVVDVP